MFCAPPAVDLIIPEAEHVFILNAECAEIKCTGRS